MNKSILSSIIILMFCTYPARGQADRVFELTATLGENSFPGIMELISMDGVLVGRITLQIGRPMHFALRERIRPAASGVSFFVGAPAVKMEAVFTDDTMTGSLVLPGNTVVNLSGNLLKIAPDSLVREQLDTNPFVPGTISTFEYGEIFPTFSQDGFTLYFGRFGTNFSEQTVMVSRLEGSQWQKPEVASFSGQFSNRSPFVAPDGKRIFIASKRPYPGETEALDTYNIWSSAIKEDGTPGVFLPVRDLNSEANDYQLSSSRTGLFVFTSEREGGLGNQDLYLVEGLADTYERPDNLGAPLNSPEGEISGYINPTGTWIIVATSAQRDDSFGNDDLYVSFLSDIGWTDLVNLGPAVNSFANEYGATLSPDGRYLFFTSDRRPPADIYRVAIEDM